MLNWIKALWRAIVARMVQPTPPYPLIDWSEWPEGIPDGYEYDPNNPAVAKRKE